MLAKSLITWTLVAEPLVNIINVITLKEKFTC